MEVIPREAFESLSLSELPERIRQHIEIGEDGCWLWTGRLSRNGYGRFYFQGKEYNAARFIYDLFVSPLGPGRRELDHRCPNRPRRSCVCPDHLVPVSRRTNTLRSTNPCAVNARKTTCKHGHPLSGDNLRYSKRGNGKRFRVCKQCAANAKSSKSHLR